MFEDLVDPRQGRQPADHLQLHADDLDRLDRLADASGFVVEWELVPLERTAR